MDYTKEQKELCGKYQADFCESLPKFKIGISRNFKKDIQPINGLRHVVEGDTTGWYIWSGEEFSNDADFFVPLHVEHLVDLHLPILKYLGLAPGWRFLFTQSYEDVWQDLSLLNVD